MQPKGFPINMRPARHTRLVENSPGRISFSLALA